MKMLANLNSILLNNLLELFLNYSQKMKRNQRMLIYVFLISWFGFSRPQ